jgi:hypothetical protein
MCQPAFSDTAAGAYKGDFAIAGDAVVPDTAYIARFRLLGAEISSNGNYDIPVTISIKIGDKTMEPFGPFNSPVSGSVNDHEFPKDLILEDHYAAGTPFTIEAKSWVHSSTYDDGEQNSDWMELINIDSDSTSANLIVLRNGDPVPQIEPFLNQAQIGSLVKEHVNSATGLISIKDDEAIFLFELGTTNLSSPAADFQDLVVLVTLADDKAHFEGPRVLPGALYD